jgi:hypothetical protein
MNAVSTTQVVSFINRLSNMTHPCRFGGMPVQRTRKIPVDHKPTGTKRDYAMGYDSVIDIPTRQ